jgi:hypothetical protein
MLSLVAPILPQMTVVVCTCCMSGAPHEAEGLHYKLQYAPIMCANIMQIR